MSGFDRPGSDRTFTSDYSSIRTEASAPYERSPAQKAADAETIAQNFDGQTKAVRQKVAAMNAAAAAGDVASYHDAEHDATVGLAQLEHIAQGVTKDVMAAASPEVRHRLETVAAELQLARNAVASAAPEPAGRAPTLLIGHRRVGSVLDEARMDGWWHFSVRDSRGELLGSVYVHCETGNVFWARTTLTLIELRPHESATKRMAALGECHRPSQADI